MNELRINLEKHFFEHVLLERMENVCRNWFVNAAKVFFYFYRGGVEAVITEAGIKII